MRRPVTDTEMMASWAAEVPNLDPLVEAPCAMSGMERLSLFALVAGLRPQRYLEVGSFRGGSALIVTHAMNVSGNADGRLTLVDPGEVCAIAPDVWIRIQDRAELIVGYSPNALGVLTPGFDFVLIDGDHSEPAALADLKAAWPLLAPGGTLLAHDWRMPTVRRAIEAFVKETPDLIAFGLIAEDHRKQMGLWLARKSA